MATKEKNIKSVRLEGADKTTLTFSTWGDDGTKQPRGAKEPKATIDVIINDKKTQVFHNTSGTGTDYYFVQLEDQWMWTKTKVTAQSYKTYVKPAPAPKEKKTPKADAKAQGAATGTAKPTAQAKPAPASGVPIPKPSQSK